MVRKQDLKKLNSIMQEGNTFKNKKNFNKAIEKYFEALNFIETKVKELADKKDELNSIRSQIDQVYSIEIIDFVDKLHENVNDHDFKEAFQTLEEAMRIADKIEDTEMRNLEIEQINYLINKTKFDESIHKGNVIRDEGQYDNAINLLKETLVQAEKFHSNDPDNKQITEIKNAINKIYSIQTRILIDQGNKLTVDNIIEEALISYQEALKIADKFFESELKSTEIANLKKLINQLHINSIKPILEEGEKLFEENRFEESVKKYETALEIASKMFPSTQKDEKINEINSIAAKTINPTFLERTKPILDKGKELIIKEFYEEDVNIVNEAIDLFDKALKISEKMADAEDKTYKVKEIRDLINKTCQTRINLLKDRSLQQIAQRNFEKAVNELYAAISIAKRMAISEGTNEAFNDLKDSVNKVYILQIDEILNKGQNFLKQKEFGKSIDLFNNALKMTDKMYLTKEMEQEVSKIKSLIYQAELKHLVGKGNLTEEQKKFEKELEKLNKKMEYAKTIDDIDRRYEEMDKIKRSIDEIHFSEIKLLVEKGVQLSDNKKFDKGFENFEKAIKVHELIESPEFKNRVPIRFNYKNELIKKARIDIFEKKFEDAIKSCEKALELDNSFIDAYYHMGIANIRKNDYDLGRKSLKKVIDLKSDHSESWNLIGFTHEKKKEFDSALAAYDQAIQHKPDFAEAYYNKGNVLKNKEQHEEAIKSYSKAIEFDPKLSLAWLFLASEFFGKKDYDKAIHHLEKAMEIDSSLKEGFIGQLDQFKQTIKTMSNRLEEIFLDR
ncbi:MAG: tetratricopeptide repeat protein [Promethearchaeota archaeon]